MGAALDNAGAIVQTTVRDAWGRMFAGSQTDRYGFAQREHDIESGLVFMRHRMYDPSTGRFTQTDPILGNRPSEHYAYGSNNPVSRVDPMGLQDSPADQFDRARRARAQREWQKVNDWSSYAEYINSLGGWTALQDLDRGNLLDAATPEQLGLLTGFGAWSKSRRAAIEEAAYRDAFERADQDAWEKEFGGLTPGQRVTKYQRNINDPLFHRWFVEDAGVQAHLESYNRKFETFVGIGGTWWFPMFPGGGGGGTAASEIARRTALFARGRQALAQRQLALKVGVGAAHADEFLRVVSNIDNVPGLVRHAENAGSHVQKSLDHLVSELTKGNMNPGIGTKNLQGNIFYARSRDGARVFFRRTPGQIEIIGKADKSNEAAVIDLIQRSY